MTALDLAAVRVRGAIVPVSDAEVDELELELGVRMPDGYRDYVTTLGEGGLDDLVRVLPPWQIRARLDEHRARMAAYWFWRGGVESFGQDEAMTSFPVADTMNGDAIAFVSGDPRLFVLPRDSDDVVVGSDGFLGLMEWVCRGGLGHRPATGRSFEPWDSRPLLQELVRTAGASAVDLVTPPDLRRPPRDVLLAYFAELADVEAWAAANWRPDRSDLTVRDGIADRSDLVVARFGTAAFARGLRGGSVSISETPVHAASGIRILDAVEMRPGRVRITASHGPLPEVYDYVLERTGDEWRIASQQADFASVPPPALGDPPSEGGGWLRKLFGRRAKG